MRTFTDNKDRQWEVELNVWQMKRLREMLGLDIGEILDAAGGKGGANGTLERLASDPCLLVDALWVLVEKQAKAAGVTDEDFGSALSGDSIEAATDAFLDELVDFFPGARRILLRKALALARKERTRAEEALAAALESPEFEERLKTSLRPPTASPGSAE